MKTHYLVILTGPSLVTANENLNPKNLTVIPFSELPQYVRRKLHKIYVDPYHIQNALDMTEEICRGERLFNDYVGLQDTNARIFAHVVKERGIVSFFRRLQLYRISVKQDTIFGNFLKEKFPKAEIKNAYAWENSFLRKNPVHIGRIFWYNRGLTCIGFSKYYIMFSALLI